MLLMTTVERARSVLIVDDEAEFRARIRSLIGHARPSTLIGEAGTAGECLLRLDERAWDVVLLDISMPGRSGLSVLQDIKRLWDALPVVMLSGLPESQYGATARRAGASAYVEKDRAPEELVTVIDALVAGERA
jgi:two-component system, NarL family, invasion response regulator UvrY